jgi:cytoskeletal protein CcmA (bactofilin family)
LDGVTATAAELNLLDGSIAGTVVNSKAVIYGAAGQVEATTVEFDNLSGTGAVSVTNILDEDNMASDSATALATQQSIKAYVDSQVGTVDTLAEILAIGNTTGATDIAVDSAQKVQFRDAAIYINSSVDGQLDIVADTEIQIAATTVDLNGNLDVSGTLGVTGVLTATSLDISGDIDVDGTTNLDVVDIDGAVDMASTLLVTGVLTTTAATVSNGGGQFNGAINVGVDDTGYDVKFFGATTGKSLLWDESADSLIVTGTTTLVGTTNLDAVDIDGATQIDATVTVGVDDTGYDVKFFGATAGAYMLWDESADDLILGGAAGSFR